MHGIFVYTDLKQREDLKNDREMKIFSVIEVVTVVIAGAGFVSTKYSYSSCTHWLPSEATTNLSLIANSTYCANETLIVPANVTLEIVAGVVILLDRNCSIVVEGTLKVEGTLAQPVVLSSLRDPCDAHNCTTISNQRYLLQSGGYNYCIPF